MTHFRSEPEPPVGITPVEHTGSATTREAPAPPTGHAPVNDQRRAQLLLASVMDRIGTNRCHKVILAIVVFGAFFDVIEQNTVGIVGPFLKEQWGVSSTGIGFLASATFGSMYVGAALAGWLSDLKGRKTMFNFNLALYSLGALVCALAPNFEVLVTGRVIVGLGLGGEFVVGLTLLAEMTSTQFRGTAISLLQVGAGGLGNPAAYLFGWVTVGMVGPHLPQFLGGPDTGWRWVFVLLCLPALLVLYTRRHMPETPRYLVSKARTADANRSLSVLASGRMNPRGLVVTDYLPDGLRLTEEKARWTEILKGRLGRNSAVLGSCTAALFGAQFVLLTFWPTILVDRGYPVATSLAFTMIIFTGAVTGTLFATFLNTRCRRRPTIAVAAALSCASALAFPFLANGVTAILVLGFLFEFFSWWANCSISTWCPELYPTRVRAFGIGVISNLGMIGGALLPPVAGALLGSMGSTALLSLVAVMCAVVLVAVPFGPETFGRSLEELHDEN
ncbi:MFS transporter [Streptomyces sp. NBC_01280]|uniref:MFS transporter n=1 Tax=unclassified Streptomyces TaxID=2593676 RepID=UPI002E3701A9|nr:MFS transporter [Streptomyces sp. NBC_01280]WSE12475.1 MFS transporter [Streptomyces sp. NBC_01397]